LAKDFSKFKFKSRKSYMIESSEKKTFRPLQKMFMSVPPRYDMLNRLLTLRFDERWRKKAAEKLLDKEPGRLLDLCSGTGDLAIRLKQDAPSDVEIHALDFSQPMLHLAEKKAKMRNIKDIRFQLGDAASMPYSDGFFDGVGIAFAFRNLTYKNPDTQKFFGEILRVLRPGGRFVAVETSQPENKVLRRLYHFQLKYITAPIGGWLSGEKQAYTYLAESASNFYFPGEMKEILLKAGFKKVKYKQLIGGVAALWVCTK
jgi:demethylmenaquinone methyltransferase/2-methoxy-6-polyprenyl-1,4-benzoquinol methylase